MEGDNNKIRVYIAKDWFGTLCFYDEPHLCNNGNGEMEWDGARCPEFESLIPTSVRNKIKKLDPPIQAEVSMTIID